MESHRILQTDLLNFAKTGSYW